MTAPAKIIVALPALPRVVRHHAGLRCFVLHRPPARLPKIEWLKNCSLVNTQLFREAR